jgi:tight adherence protein B
LLARVRVLSSKGACPPGSWDHALRARGLMQLTNPEFIGTLWTDPIGISIVKYMLV